jgi:hypothetical protein
VALAAYPSELPSSNLDFQNAIELRVHIVNIGRIGNSLSFEPSTIGLFDGAEAASVLLRQLVQVVGPQGFEPWTDE